jgi:hypothetical protein
MSSVPAPWRDVAKAARPGTVTFVLTVPGGCACAKGRRPCLREPAGNGMCAVCEAGCVWLTAELGGVSWPLVAHAGMLLWEALGER